MNARQAVNRAPDHPLIDTARLCWCTRGKHWDYSILCHPAQPARPGWLGLLSQIFQDIDPAEDAAVHHYLQGRIVWERGISSPPSRYIAFCCMDGSRRDRDSRQIKHFLFYLLHDEDELAPFSEGWHLHLLKALAAPYDEIFALTAEDLHPDQGYTTIFDERELLRRFAAALPPQVPLETSPSVAAPTSVTWIRRNISLRKRVPLRQLALGAAALSVVLLAVLLRGERPRASRAGPSDLAPRVVTTPAPAMPRLVPGPCLPGSPGFPWSTWRTGDAAPRVWPCLDWSMAPCPNSCPIQYLNPCPMR